MVVVPWLEVKHFHLHTAENSHEYFGHPDSVAMKLLCILHFKHEKDILVI